MREMGYVIARKHAAIAGHRAHPRLWPAIGAEPGRHGGARLACRHCHDPRLWLRHDGYPDRALAVLRRGQARRDALLWNRRCLTPSIEFRQQPPHGHCDPTPPQGAGDREHIHHAVGRLPPGGANLAAGRCRKESGSGDPGIPALSQARWHGRARPADSSLFRRPWLCLRAGRYARWRRVRRAPRGRVPAAGAGRLPGGDALDRELSPGAPASSA